MLNPKLKPSLILALLLCAGMLTSACSSKRYDAYSKSGQHSALPSTNNTERTTKLTTPPPWESWAYGRDLQGKALTNVALLKADQFLKDSSLQQALDEFTRMQPSTLSPSEKEALTIRRASTELRLGLANEALRTLSSYFSSSGRSVSDVDARFALVFAFAYGYKSDFDQSLAWFSRSYQSSTPQESVRQQSQQGVKSLLRTIPTERFEALSKTWSSDTFIYKALGAERSYRARPGFSDPILSTKNRFWDPAAPESSNASTHLAPSAISLAALLPLSGQFSSLGNHIKNGIELALESIQGEGASVPLVVRDTTATPSQAIAAAQELMSRKDLSVILGPLLNEEAIQVSEVARQHRFPLLTFSKSANFQVGEGVFRLGPTASSQVDSLLETVNKSLGVKRYAIIFPNEPSGHEFEELFRNKLHELSLELVYQMAYPSNDHNAIATIAKELEDKEIDAVFMPDGLLEASRLVGALSTPARRRMHFLGTALWDNPPELTRSSAVFDDLIFVSPFFSTNTTNPDVLRFVQSYSAKYRALPDFLAAQGFDATLMIASALRNQQAQGISIDQALTSLNTFDGLTGSIQVDASGEFKRHFHVVRFKSGAITELLANPAQNN